MVKFLKEIYKNHSILSKMAVKDFKMKYLGSYLGVIWGIINPLLTIIIYWIVFGFGLKAGERPNGEPFVVWMVTGIVPWLYFVEVVSVGTSCLIEYSYIVKKMVFNVKLLPIVKSISSLFVLVIFTTINLFILIFYGYTPSVYWIQAIFYYVLMYIFVIGLIYLTAAIAPFFRDLPQIVSIVLQLGFWATPIIWDFTILPDQFRALLLLNPMYYIVEGLRNSYINNIWIWETTEFVPTIVFAIIALVLLKVGMHVFNKVETSFVDIL